MIECDDLNSQAAFVSLIQHCDVIHNGALRLVTPFYYPDGSQLDLFLSEREPLMAEYILSDSGQTTAYLLDLNVKPRATKRRRQMVESVCSLMGVEWKGGQFQIPLNQKDLQSLGVIMLKLAQACVRISDLAFSQRLRSADSFRDEVEEFIAGIEDIVYEPDLPLPTGEGDEVIKIDFTVTGRSSISLVETLSAGSAHTAHNAANEVFRKWWDLRKRAEQRVTIFDDSRDLFRESDLRRLEQFSTVVGFPTEQEGLQKLLAA